MCSGTETQTFSVTATASLVTSECGRSYMTKGTAVLIAFMSGCKGMDDICQ